MRRLSAFRFPESVVATPFLNLIPKMCRMRGAAFIVKTSCTQVVIPPRFTTSYARTPLQESIFSVRYRARFGNRVKTD